MRHYTWPSLVKIRSSCLIGAKPLSELMWLIVIYTLGIKCRWIRIQTTTMSTQENEFENVCKMVSILSHPQYIILSWSWLNIWFEPMRWLVLGHVTGISSATTTCQPRPAKHNLCVSLAFELIKNRSLMPKNVSELKDQKVIDMETHFFNFYSRWENHLKWYSFHCVTLAFFQKLLLLCLTQVLKVMLKVHIYA